MPTSKEMLARGQYSGVRISSILPIGSGCRFQVGVAPTCFVRQISIARFVQSAAVCSWTKTFPP